MQSHGASAPSPGPQRLASARCSGAAARCRGPLCLTLLGRRPVTFDMGVTSTDIALLQGGEPTCRVRDRGSEARCEPESTRSAQVGSIAPSTAEGSFTLRGERGAAPGPACYGAVHEADRPARISSRFLDPGNSSAGSRSIPPRRRARGHASPRRRRSMLAAGEDLCVGHTNMAMASSSFVRRGVDPRRFALVRRRRGGPHHAGAQLEIRRVWPPRGVRLIFWGCCHRLRYELCSRSHELRAEPRPCVSLATLEREGATLGAFAVPVRSGRPRHAVRLADLRDRWTRGSTRIEDVPIRSRAIPHAARGALRVQRPGQEVVVVTRASRGRALDFHLPRRRPRERRVDAASSRPERPAAGSIR